MEPTSVKLSDIKVGDRYRLDYGDLTELKTSIKSKGLINPLTVCQLEDGTLQLAAGGRRFQAVTELGWEEVEVRIFKGDPLDLRTVELFENVHRKDLSWQERARLTEKVHRLQEEKHGTKGRGRSTGWGQTDTAKMLGMSRQSVGQQLELAQQLKDVPELAKCLSPADVQKLVKKADKNVKLNVISTKKLAEADKDKRELVDRYITGDFFEEAQSLKSCSVDFIDLDPPYGVGYEELTGEWDEEWDDWTEETYPDNFQRTAKECFRLLDTRGWMVVWLASRRLDVTIDTLESVGFRVWKVPAIWVKKPGNLQAPKWQLRNAYEPFLYCRKKHGEIIKQGRTCVFEYPQTKNKIHPTEKPIPLMKDILETFCVKGSKVLVPFAGSGNTILAADRLVMPSFGYDLSPKNKKAFTVKALGG